MSNPCSLLSRPARASAGLSRLALATGLLAALAVEAPGGAQFVLWETQSVPNPFSVTTAVRGVTPSPSLKLEGLVGFGGAGNQFVYHVTPALSATSPTADLCCGSASRFLCSGVSRFSLRVCCCCGSASRFLCSGSSDLGRV